MEKDQPLIVMLAGSNGAGKSSFFHRHLEGCALPFINADLIQFELTDGDVGGDPYRAAKIAEQRRQEMVADRRSFIFETVFSDAAGAKIEFLCRAQAEGFFISAHFICLGSPDLAVMRVAHRVARGGHPVAEDKIRERYERGLTNLKRFAPSADQLTLYDNSSAAEPHRPVAYLEKGAVLELADPIPAWAEALVRYL